MQTKRKFALNGHTVFPTKFGECLLQYIFTDIRKFAEGSINAAAASYDDESTLWLL